VKSAAILGAALIAVSGQVRAQELSVLAGALYAEYADSITGTAALLSLKLGATSNSATGVVDLGLSQFTDGGWVGQAFGYGTAVLIGSHSRFGVGIAGGGEANYPDQGSVSGSVSAGPLLAFSEGPFLATIGGSLGGVRTVDEVSFGIAASNLRLSYGTGLGFRFAGGIAAVSGDTNQYADVTVEAGYTSQRLRVALAGGVRVGELENDPWGQAKIVTAITPWVLLEIAGGSYPQDLVGFTNGLYANLGLRVNLSGAARQRYRPPPPPPLTVQPLEAGESLLVIAFRRTVDRLEIAGDWNGWSPTPLEHMGENRWSASLSLNPGIYHYSLVVDGSEWTLPEGAASVSDEFGGVVGLLVIKHNDQR
jgi:hypothetical protein